MRPVRCPLLGCRSRRAAVSPARCTSWRGCCCKPGQHRGADVAAWDTSEQRSTRAKGSPGENNWAHPGRPRERTGGGRHPGDSWRWGDSWQGRQLAGRELMRKQLVLGQLPWSPLPRLMEAFELIMCDVDEVRGCFSLSNTRLDSCNTHMSITFNRSLPAIPQFLQNSSPSWLAYSQ